MIDTTGTRPAPWAFLESTGASGFVSDIGGIPVHWVRWDPAGSSDEADPIVLVHGLGGSHTNWMFVGQPLAVRRTVYAIDLAGFGLTPGLPRRDTSVVANAVLLAQFLEQVVGAPAVLVGNSMGGLISGLLAARRPELVSALVLVDPALPMVRPNLDAGVAQQLLPFAIPGVGEALMRRMVRTMPSEAIAKRTMDLCFADPDRVPWVLVDLRAQMDDVRRDSHNGMGDIEHSFAIAARSTLARLTARRGYYRELAAYPGPVLLIQGDQDRLVAVSSARAVASRNPGWTYVELADVGHTPQLEVPQDFVEIVQSWLADL